MKLFPAILLTIFIIIAISFLPEELITPVISFLAAISAIWIYGDAKKLNAKKYKSAFGMSPLVLSLLTFGLWAIFFPGYLQLRYKIKNNLVPIKEKYKTPPQP